MFELVSIDDVPTTEILEFCQKQYDGEWEERFAEDLVEVMTTMGHRPGKTVKLVLRDRKTQEEKTIAKAAMTHENRQSVYETREELEFQPRPLVMSRALDEFQRALETRWSYYRANNADFDGAVDELRTKIGAEISPNDFAIELQKIIALGIDGHARVSGYQLKEGYLPFLIDTKGERFVAFHESREEFIHEVHPYIERMDGRPLDEWIEAASVLVTKGSPQKIRRDSLRQLRYIQHWRGEIGLKTRDTIRLDLVSRDGKRGGDNRRRDSSSGRCRCSLPCHGLDLYRLHRPFRTDILNPQRRENPTQLPVSFKTQRQHVGDWRFGPMQNANA